MQAQARTIPLRVDAETYRSLEEQARSQERDPIQQARWIIKQALAEPERQPAEAPT